MIVSENIVNTFLKASDCYQKLNVSLSIVFKHYAKYIPTNFV